MADQLSRRLTGHDSDQPETARPARGLRRDVRLIGFTGGEPFMNPRFPLILDETLRRGFQTLTLSNAMKPMQLRRQAIKALVA